LKAKSWPKLSMTCTSKQNVRHYKTSRNCAKKQTIYLR
jgi:hypothetical protein